MLHRTVNKHRTVYKAQIKISQLRSYTISLSKNVVQKHLKSHHKYWHVAVDFSVIFLEFKGRSPLMNYALLHVFIKG